MIKKIILLFVLLTAVNSYSQQTPMPITLTPLNIGLKFSLKYQITQNSFIEVPDTVNHRLGTATGTGVALFNDSISVPFKSYFTYDYYNGNGNFVDYYYFMFPNGSSFTVQAYGIAQGAAADGSSPLFQAKTAVTYGIGDFQNFYAEGVMSGNRNYMVESNSTVRLSFDMKQLLRPVLPR
jgi:hypothetical protein